MGLYYTRSMMIRSDRIRVYAPVINVYNCNKQQPTKQAPSEIMVAAAALPAACGNCGADNPDAAGRPCAALMEWEQSIRLFTNFNSHSFNAKSPYTYTYLSRR